MECGVCCKSTGKDCSSECSKTKNQTCSSLGSQRSEIPPPANSFSPLSNPRGSELKCEVCSKPAYLQCSNCRVTYYCNIEHQKLDWIGIHDQICSTVEWLRKPMPFISSECERQKKMEEIRQTQIKLVEVAKVTGMKLLFTGNAEAAVPAALQCLKMASVVYGSASAELVVPYLLLAESNIILNRLDHAESYLAQAQWIMLKTQHEGTDAVRSMVQRKLGLLFSAKNEFQAALECLAQDIYYSSCAYGPNHIRTAGGYFIMADVFYKLYKNDKTACEAEEGSRPQCPQGLISPSASPQIPGYEGCRPMPPALLLKERDSCEDVALAVNSPLFLSRVYKKPSVLPKPMQRDQVADDLYTRVVDIWANHLSAILETHTYRTPISADCEAAFSELKAVERRNLDETDAAEATQMLNAIRQYRLRRIAVDGKDFTVAPAGRPDPRVRLPIALATLQLLLDNKVKAKQYYEEAVEAMKTADDNKKLNAEMETLRTIFEN